MVEDVAGWLSRVAPDLGGYELLALQLIALCASVLLVVLSLLALARVGRLLSDTHAIRLRTDAIEGANVRFAGELQGMRERYAVLLAESNARRPQSAGTARSRKSARQTRSQPTYTRRYGEGRTTPPTVH